ncbi:DUF2891 domain-containing protein [Actinomadura sp. HBU206391]|uniref:DUF2891 domain-containing protein n=1 Tax=Actinomadura sp. HBU206391 TaxID=2731692 RepID=UPI00165078DB|nr:DUF2891 domain-containing protein [Actinomadura sp. HBU206391]MBC6457637.1 DUF2891 domain-containing protein [Actinomadura sp. HBU206391]
MAPSTDPRPSVADLAPRLARLALDNVTREFPNAPQHLVKGPDDVALPRVHHPAFYGSYDWHSAVHMHWLLIRLLRRHREVIDEAAVREVLDRHLTAGHLATEAAYLRVHPTFERPYGWAWLLALAAECGSAGADGARWADALRPAVTAVAGLVEGWLAKATYPVRHGVHGNSAFALGLVLDSAEEAGCAQLVPFVSDVARRWFGADHDYPAAWEPSGHDFVSPALTEADLMRRVLPRDEFAGWLSEFLPGLVRGEPQALLEPPTVSDPHDPHIGHLIGLALSRAAALRAITAALPGDDERIPLLGAAAEAQLNAGLPQVAAGDFTSDHWLATFAVMALETPAPLPGEG